MFTKIVMVVLCLIGVLALLVGTNSFLSARFVPQEQSGLLLMLLGVVGIGFGATIAAVGRLERTVAATDGQPAARP